MIVPSRELMPVIRCALERGQRVRMAATGGSMSPFIRDGDIVELEQARGPLSPGDVVLVQHREDRYVLHRIIAKLPDGWLVRGDCCSSPDGVVPDKDLLGVVVRVERDGRTVRMALGRGGRLIAWFSARDWLLPIMKKLYFLRRLVRVAGRRPAH